jgi:hypothetical protein
MKIKRKGLITVAISLLMIAAIIPVFALGDQSGIMKCPRDQTNEDPPGPTTRSYGENSQNPVGLSEEETLEEAETPIQEQTQDQTQTQDQAQEQTQTQEQLKECDCENADCAENQYQFQEQCRYGQEED